MVDVDPTTIDVVMEKVKSLRERHISRVLTGLQTLEEYRYEMGAVHALTGVERALTQIRKGGDE